jgi:signal transduction histidine kinase
MQADLRAALHSRARLAALGEAVAKINHDLRNMLTSAQLASERLSGSEDPRVTLALPRLERALDRAVGLTQGVLSYGRSAGEAAPERTRTPLAAAVAAAAEDAGLSDDGVRLLNHVGPGANVWADAEQLHRILVNLLRNAREALETAPATPEPQVAVDHGRLDTIDVIGISDNGPGVPEKARARLFQAFGSARAGGTGLGLAIARELAQAHGGDLTLADTGPAGTRFELRLPST